MWERFRERAALLVNRAVYRIGSLIFRILLRMLPAMLIVDVFVIRNWERFIADPLQERGVSLGMQLRSIYVVGAFMLLLSQPFSWWNFPGFFWWLYLGVFSAFDGLDQPPTDGQIYRNFAKINLFLLGLRWTMYCLCVVAAVFRTGGFLFLLLAILLTTACDVKPRRPKRLKRLVTTTEGA